MLGLYDSAAMEPKPELRQYDFIYSATGKPPYALSEFEEDVS